MSWLHRAFVSVLIVAAVTPVLGGVPQVWRATGLAAFETVWRTINETYYDPSFGGLDWSEVHQEMLPRVESAATPEQQRAVIREMIARLGQSHFALLTASAGPDDLQGEASPPFDVRMSSAGVVVTRLHREATTTPGAQEFPVRPGDVIVRIGEVPVDELIRSIDPGDPRRTELAWHRVTRALSGEAGVPVHLTVRRPHREDPEQMENDKEVEILAPRVVGPGEMVKVGNLPPVRAHLEAEDIRTPEGRRAGVIRFNIWMAAIAEPFAEAIDRFRDHDGLVIDLRGNRGGLADMIRGIAGHVLDEPAVLGRMRMRDLDLEFRANPRRSTTDGRSVAPFQGPVALLVDELTASASECFAGALQSLGRARVFGTRTSGQALPASTQQLANGDVLLYVVGDFVTSDGRRLEGTGVVPDVPVPVDPQAIASGQDALRAALEWIDTTAK